MGKRNRIKNKGMPSTVPASSEVSCSEDGSNTSKQEDVVEEELSFSYAMGLVNESVVSQALKAGMELALFDVLDEAGEGAKLSASEILTRMGNSIRNPDAPAMLDRICRVLHGVGALGCSYNPANPTSGWGYSLTNISKYFTRNKDGVSLGPLLSLYHDKVFLDSWHQLKDAILEGGAPFSRAHGMHLYEYIGKDPRFNQVFNSAMSNHTALVMRKILESYEGFANLKSLVDVGGGTGVALGFIKSKHPNIEAINFDLPLVIKHAQPYPGVKHVAGDMFESVPNGDAILLKWILRDWSDERCVRLLQNCYNALPRNGKVLVIEKLLPVMTEIASISGNAFQSDLLLMPQTVGGRERNHIEFRGLVFEAGFRSWSLIPCHALNCLFIELHKQAPTLSGLVSI